MDHHDQHNGHEVHYVHPQQSHWMDNTGYSSQHQAAASNDYGSYSFNTSHVPIEPQYATSIHGPRMNPYPSLHPLTVPPWPSMIASQQHYSAGPPQHSHAAAMQPMQNPSASSGPPSQLAPSAPIVSHGSMPRKTLTDADRRRMCLYHEENPTKKQTEIGELFGVERSTVSKVLRQKEKYLCQDDGSRSPVRKPKGKFPDVERALSNWAKNQESKGIRLTDDMIKEQARFFSNTVGGNEAQIKINNASWLEKFKQKHNLACAPTGPKSRKTSEVVDFSGLSSPSKSSPRTQSPTSNAADRMVHSASPYSVQAPFNEAASSPLFTPDSTDGGPTLFYTKNETGQSDMRRDSSNATTRSGVRKRSSTKHTGEAKLHYISPPPSTKAATPKFSSLSTSPNHQMPPPVGGNRHVSPTSSSPAISPSTATGTSLSPITPSSATAFQQQQQQQQHSHNPSSEDARRALEVVMQFLQNQQQQQYHGLAISGTASSPIYQHQLSGGGGGSVMGRDIGSLERPVDLDLDQEELMAMGKLMNKLRLQKQQQEHQQRVKLESGAAANNNNSSSAASSMLPGGMHRIPQVEFGGGDSGGGPL